MLFGRGLLTDLSDGMEIDLTREDVTVSITADGVFINDAQVTVADHGQRSGHIIDALLLPPAPPINTVVDVILTAPITQCLKRLLGRLVWLMS